LSERKEGYIRVQDFPQWGDADPEKKKKKKKKKGTVLAASLMEKRKKKDGPLVTSPPDCGHEGKGGHVAPPTE